MDNNGGKTSRGSVDWKNISFPWLCTSFLNELGMGIIEYNYFERRSVETGIAERGMAIIH